MSICISIVSNRLIGREVPTMELHCTSMNCEGAGIQSDAGLENRVTYLGSREEKNEIQPVLSHQG